MHGLTNLRPCNRCIATTMNFDTVDKRDMRHRLHTSHPHWVVPNCQKEIIGFEKAALFLRFALEINPLNHREGLLKWQLGFLSRIQLFNEPNRDSRSLLYFWHSNHFRTPSWKCPSCRSSKNITNCPRTSHDRSYRSPDRPTYAFV